MKNDKIFKEGFYHQIQEKIVQKIINIKSDVLKGKNNKYTFYDIDLMTEVMRVFGAYADFMFFVRDAHDVKIDEDLLTSRFNILDILEDIDKYKTKGIEIPSDFVENLNEKISIFPEYYNNNGVVSDTSKIKFDEYHKYLGILLN